MTDHVRIGVLGAAMITPSAVVRPARSSTVAEVVAIAARSAARAQAFADKHGIPRVHGSYEDLLADPAVDAVYNPLPNGLHGKWTLAALEAGKHVLCEKPFAADAAEARTLLAAAEKAGVVHLLGTEFRFAPGRVLFALHPINFEISLKSIQLLFVLELIESLLRLVELLLLLGLGNAALL